jgi:hypothetical protein
VRAGLESPRLETPTLLPLVVNGILHRGWCDAAPYTFPLFGPPLGVLFPRAGRGSGYLRRIEDLPMKRCMVVVAMTAAAFQAGCGDVPTEPLPEDPCAGHTFSLQVGETLGPRAAGTTCLQPVAGAEYALAALDGRAVLAAAHGREDPFSPYVARVRMLSAAAAAAPMAAVATTGSDHTAGRAQPMEIQSHGHSLYDRSTPWVLGEEFPAHDWNEAPRTARVLRIYDDGLVVAWIDGDGAELIEEFLEQLDLAIPPVTEIGLPLMQRAFVPRIPVTSAGSGQYLILLMNLPARGMVFSAVRDDAVFSLMLLSVDTGPGPTRLASLVAHELTHSYQRMYMQDTRPPGQVQAGFAAATWGAEGGANLISYEMVRRMAGIPLDGNYDWRNPAANPVAEFYALRAQPGNGEFTVGYDNAMGFFRHLIVQRVHGGEPIDDAVREISRGAIEGWFGFDRFGAHRPGLTARMRTRLGSSWQPDLALLDWTLSHAIDDLTDDPAFQDHASLRIWDIPAEMPYAWRPEGVLSTASPAFSFERGGGNPAYLYLHDDGAGLAFAISSDVGGLQWKLIRVR